MAEDMWVPRELNKPRDGMQTFSRWYRPGSAPRKISPADIDCVFHDGERGRCLFIEFKSEHGGLANAQRRTLAGLAAQGNVCLVVIAEQKDEPYPDDFPLRIGEVRPDGNVVWFGDTIAGLNARITQFYE